MHPTKEGRRARERHGAFAAGARTRTPTSTAAPPGHRAASPAMELHLAAEQGKCGRLRKLLKKRGVDVNARVEGKNMGGETIRMTALHMAVASNQSRLREKHVHVLRAYYRQGMTSTDAARRLLRELGVALARNQVQVPDDQLAIMGI